uniref:HMG box domain-containing protein n=1 Tax=Lymnaea stagnalis TaxID=6523 RepID=A0A7S6WWS2_LYMST|nr:hypothetical protein [Lymnaea stagnalis]
MPPKNAFYMFMQAERKKIMAQAGTAPPMQDMAGLCINRWKGLSPQEKSVYEGMARRERTTKGPGSKMDNQRRLISERKDPVEEEKKRRNLETQAMGSSWVGQDLKKIKFHLIDFQVMYDEREVDLHLPMEVGLVCITLADGILKSMHRFTDPGDAPQGNRRIANEYAESHHQIPLNFEQSDSDFTSLWFELEHFLADDPQRDDIPPLFCLSSNREIVESCLEFCFYKAITGEPNRIYKLYCIEDLIVTLMLRSGKINDKPALSQIYDALIQNRWDYTSNIRCQYHEQVDSCWCSISIVKRYSFVIFDLLSKLLDFKLTAKHLPDERQIDFKVMPSFGRNKSVSKREWEPRSRSPPKFMDPAPVVASKPTERYVINLSDSDDEESISASEEYQLKELRVPQTPSMSVAMSGLKLGAGRGITTLPSFPRSEVDVAPPPGFGPKPSISPSCAPAVPGAQARPQNPLLQGQGRGLPPPSGSRGRGLPPQVTMTQLAGRGRGTKDS